MRRKLEEDKRRLEVENEVLTKRIERTQQNANEALLVIIQLEFEIKTYERLLNIEQGVHDDHSDRHSVSSRHSSHSGLSYHSRRSDHSGHSRNSSRSGRSKSSVRSRSSQ